MGQIRTFYGTGYATGTYSDLYNVYLTAYWLASGAALANINCNGDYDVIYDLSIPNPIHFYNFNNDLSDSFGSSSGIFNGSSAFIWGKHNYAASGTGNVIISNIATTQLPCNFTFWTYFDNRFINQDRTLLSNIGDDGFGNDDPGASLYRIYLNTSNRMHLRVFDGTNAEDVALTGATIVSGDWQFHSLYIDSTNKIAYYSTNGSGSVATSLAGLPDPMLSSNYYSGSIFGDINGPTKVGLIDSVGFFSSQLTLNQLKALYFGGSGKYYSGGWRQ